MMLSNIMPLDRRADEAVGKIDRGPIKDTNKPALCMTQILSEVAPGSVMLFSRKGFECIHFVSVHLTPLSTGQPVWREASSRVPLGCMSQKRTASPEEQTAIVNRILDIGNHELN